MVASNARRRMPARSNHNPRGTLIVLLAILALPALSGCLTSRIPTDVQREHFGRMAVASATYTPRLDLSDMPMSKGAGAASGAGQGAMEGLAQCGGAGVLAPLCALLMVPVGAGIGAVTGAVMTETPDVDSLERARKELDITAARAQQAVLSQVQAYAARVSAYPLAPSPIAGPSQPEPEPKAAQGGASSSPGQPTAADGKAAPAAATSRVDYTALAGNGIGSVLEVSVTRIKTTAFRNKNRVAFTVRARVRVIDVADNSVAYTVNLSRSTPALRPGDWLLDDGGNLGRHLEQAFRRLGEDIVDVVFRLDDDGWVAAGNGKPPATVEPVKPVTHPFQDPPMLDSLRPTLEWKPFPSSAQRKNYAPRFAAVSDESVRYELRVLARWEGQVYRRHGLTGVKHTLEQPLESCRMYFWSVRAEYSRNGHPHVSLYRASRFRTPCGITSEAVTPVPAPEGTEAFSGMVHVPAGRFRMGSNPGPARRPFWPPHSVVLNKDFYLDRTEVTQRAFLKVMGHNPSGDYQPGGPVTRVTWDEARRFCQRVRKRLPTEAEWEYAARAGATSAYSFGNEAKDGYGTYCIRCEASSSIKGSGPSHPTLVGRTKPNGWGLFDLYGNVAEWVADWYAPYDNAAHTDPHGPDTGQEKVLRGGTYLSDIGETTSYARDGAEPSTREETIGFRCAADALPR